MTDTKEIFSLLLWSVGICYTNFSMMKLETKYFIKVCIIFKSAEFCTIIPFEEIMIPSTIDFSTIAHNSIPHGVYSNLYWVTVITIVFVLCNVNKCNFT